MKTKHSPTVPLPTATVERLCLVFGLCADLASQGVDDISSAQIGERIGAPAHNVRKDISYAGEAGRTGAGYDIGVLKRVIGERLGLEGKKRTCVVGLGRLGCALLTCQEFWAAGFPIVAGFDASTNRLETIRTPVPLYPAYQIADVVRREGIAIALLSVPADAARKTAEALAAGGISGIVNFSPVVLPPLGPAVCIRNVNVVNELRVVSAMASLLTIHQSPITNH